MYNMAKGKVYEILDVLLLVLVLDVNYGVQHVPQVLESVFNRFLLKN